MQKLTDCLEEKSVMEEIVLNKSDTLRGLLASPLNHNIPCALRRYN